MMRFKFRRFALGAAVLACAGFVLGAGIARWAERGDTDDVTGSIGIASRKGLPLSLEERAQIFDSVMRITDAPVADVTPPAPAEALPRSVALQDLPPGVVRQIPRVEGYKFVKLDDRILLVNPNSRTVAAEMPRYKLVLN
jgi:hypothetical protein